jgi:hypothetical protein
MRRVEVLQRDGSWVERESIKDVEDGEIIRMFNPDGTVFMQEDGSTIWQAVVNDEHKPYMTDDGWGIDVFPVTMNKYGVYVATVLLEEGDA